MRKLMLICLVVTLLSPISALADLVNINTAGSSELETLNGIGPSKATAIIEYRTQNGPFETIEEIKNVSGIGDVTYENIKNFITVGSSSSNNSTSQNTSSTNTSTNEIGSSGSGASDSGSQQSSVVISTADGVIPLYASAGRARVVPAGMPVEFKAWVSETKTGANISDARIDWSFGDGSFGGGADVRHIYRAPGEYVVVLRGFYAGKEAIARTTVTVVPFDIVIKEVRPGESGGVKILNNSENEINIGGVSIVQGIKRYTAPRDTIILPHRSIELNRDALWFAPSMVETTIELPGNNVVSTWRPNSTISNTIAAIQGGDQRNYSSNYINRQNESVVSSNPFIGSPSIVTEQKSTDPGEIIISKPGREGILWSIIGMPGRALAWMFQ